MRIQLLLVATISALISLKSARAQNADNYTGNFWAPLCGSKMESERVLCTFYLRGMNDVNDFLLFVTKKPIWCVPEGVTVEQMRLVVMASVNKNPEHLHHPFAGLVMIALKEKFPCPGSN